MCAAESTSRPPSIHLHVHSCYSLLGGTATVDDLAARAAAEGMSHLALTDSHALYGAVAFARACADHDLAPITGMTVTMQSPDSVMTDSAAAGSAARNTRPDRLVLLAADATGYRSLCRLSSALQAHADRADRLARGLAWQTLRD
ncbi:MAG: PHP domain-containing protein, partial [Caldilineaceae bacterium]|nr:PHP domain-containing protein [Caldilineaceae bacterium]